MRVAALVASREYDLIITDIRMPEMSGLDFLREGSSRTSNRGRLA